MPPEATDNASRTPSRVPPGDAAVAVGPHGVWVDAEYRPALERAGLTTFEDLMTRHGGEQLRALADRENWRMEVVAASGERSKAYLKKHRRHDAVTRLRRRFGRPPATSPGRYEAEMLWRLAHDGIPAMRLIAFGEKFYDDGRCESFLLTEDLAGFTQLDHFLRKRFAERATRGTTGRDHELSRLIEEVADAAARFHSHGYNHRALYCCHFFIRARARGAFDVHRIDLPRVTARRPSRHRWMVKDLAQLAYSAPRERIGCTERMGFVKRYMGVRKLRPADKRLIRQVLAKQQRMEAKLGPHP